MPDTEGPPTPPTPHRRLDGWKEIAQYLNRSVRTAYRWERDLGLPVRRLGTGKGEVVFALPEELDAWRERLEVTHNGEAALRAEPDGPERRPGGPPPSASPGRSAGAGGAVAIRRWRGLSWPLVAMAALVVGGLGYGVYRVLASPPKAVTCRVLGGELEVFDAQHRLLWRQAFQPSLEDALYAHRLAAHTRDATFVDLRGDGRQELLFLVNPGTPWSRGLYCFDERGRTLFHHQPTRSVRYGVQTYAGPWRPECVFVTDEPAGKKAIWLVSTHYQEFPCVLEKLDPAGNVLGEYWSDGYIYSLSQREVDHHRVLYVGAVNNEYRGASLAVLDPDHAVGSAPAMSAKYTCQDCPPGRPTAFLVLPRTDVAVATGGLASVREIIVDHEEQLRLEILQSAGLAWESSGGVGPYVFYLLDRNLRVIDAEFGDTYPAAHRMLEGSGLLNRPFVKDPSLLFPVRRWDGSKFVEIPGPQVRR